MRRQHQSQSQLQIEQSGDDCTSSPAQILERVQSDRVTVTKPEEDRRRRTIIVEKKNGSYGFTLQSYGIHYKREQEIEMITYVDFVDYDGPAYRAGMREGDVILSINGTDMEKADHKTLVNFIKNCDTRMRMVVLFEDCVRKVELHMRYIQLQRLLQTKMAELEKLCVRERQLLEGKWKTHSLPARKKSSQNSNDPPTPTVSYSYCRPTVSTEDVAKHVQQTKPNPPFVFAYHYLDSQYVVPQSTTSSGEYLLGFDQSQYQVMQDQKDQKIDKHQNKIQSRANQTNSVDKKKSLVCHSYAGQLCNPCVQANSNNGDNTSLEAYDLASPCCDPHCVPTRRRRHHKDHRKRDSKTEETQTEQQLLPQQQVQRSRPHSQTIQTQTYSVPRRYFHFGSGLGLVSQCSLHSCTSSECSGVIATTMGESSANSYTTSLSTDTLYWDGTDSRQMSLKSAKHESQCHQQQQMQNRDLRYQNQEPIYVQYSQVKPKSWDNLATKAFGGYCYGYGYSDPSSHCMNNKSATTGRKNQSTQYVRIDKQTSTSSMPPPQYTPHAHRRYFQATKSTESLLSVPKYGNDSETCECLEGTSPTPDNEGRFFQSPRQSVVSPTDPNFGYYSARRTSRSEQSKNVSTSSEATRL